MSKTGDAALTMLALVSDRTTGGNPMADYTSGDLNPVDRLVRLDDGDMHVVESGQPGAPAPKHAARKT